MKYLLPALKESLKKHKITLTQKPNSKAIQRRRRKKKSQISGQHKPDNSKISYIFLY